MSSRRHFIQRLSTLALAAVTWPPTVPARAQDTTPPAASATPVIPVDISSLPLKHEGQLTIHADQPVYPPWFVGNDPTLNQGFESVVAYAVAARLGINEDQIEWGFTSFDNSFNAGEKAFDYFLNQVEITSKRLETVDFSTPYYRSPLTLMAKTGSPILAARTLAELRAFTYSAQSNTTSAHYLESILKPDRAPQLSKKITPVLVALDKGDVDATILPLQSAIINVTTMFDDLSLGGILPGMTADLGLVCEKGSALLPYLDAAIASIGADGMLAAITAQWLPNPPGLSIYSG